MGEDSPLDFRSAAEHYGLDFVVYSGYYQQHAGYRRRFPQEHREGYSRGERRDILPGLRRVTDPARSGVTPNLTGTQNLQSQFANLAIADAQGNLLLVTRAPGQLGTLGQRWIEGPSHTGLHVNLVKRLRIDETKVFESRFAGRHKCPASAVQ